MRYLYGFLLLIGIHVVATEATHATLVERVVVVDLETDGRITQFERQAWEGIVEVEKFDLQAGDQLKLIIRFANNQHLELTDRGSGIQGGLEPTKLTLLFEDPGSNIRWETSGTYTYKGVMGELLTNPTPFRISGAGAAYQGQFKNENLTNSYFVYHGVDLKIDVESWELREGSGIFNRFEWSSAAQQVRIGDWNAVSEINIDPKIIDPRSRDVIAVTILTTDTFDAQTVDPSTVGFGPDGAVIEDMSVHFEDVDVDGDADLVLYFRTPETGIACGDTSASLTGMTFGGGEVKGLDSIKTVGCK